MKLVLSKADHMMLFFMCSILTISLASTAIYAQQNTEPPLKQSKTGIPLYEITCKQDLTLVKKLITLQLV